MDLSATMTQIASLSIEDRIRLVQAIWDSIEAEQAHPDLSDAQRHDLDRRTAELDAHPENVLTWEEIKTRIRDKQ